MSNDAGTTKSNPEQASPIVVATDFSPDSEAALIWAGRHAALTGAPLKVLHVVHDPAEAAGFYRSEESGPHETMTAVAEQMMSKFLDKVRDANLDLTPIRTADSEVVAGLPAGRIVEVAEREDAPLIVIGSRGLTGLSSILVGSIAETVAQTAPMPVVIVKTKTGETNQ